MGPLSISALDLKPKIGQNNHIVVFLYLYVSKMNVCTHYDQKMTQLFRRHKECQKAKKYKIGKKPSGTEVLLL